MLKVNTSLWNTTDHIVIAVSTGIDSMSLLHHLLTQLSHTYKQLTCLHVNHGLREASHKEEAFIKAFCKQHAIPCYVKRLNLTDIVAQGKSIQADARYLRYEWFDEMMKQLKADVLLTAHHLDDQLETIFYRLFTGRSTRSTLGIDVQSKRRHYTISRPLLEVSKDDIRDYQHKYQVPYYEDSSNSDNKYVRNDIRNRLLPAINQNSDLDSTHLLKLKRWHDIQLRESRKKADAFIEHDISINNNATQIQCARHAFNQLDDITKMVLLDQLFKHLQLDKSFSEKQYHEWFAQIDSEIAQFEISLTEKWIIQMAYDKFIILAKNEPSLLDNQIVNQANTYRFGSYHIVIHPTIPHDQLPLLIRTRRNGDKVELNGQQGHKKVGRLFIDYKIPNDARMQMPVIENQHHQIIAVGNLYIAQAYNQHIEIKKIGDE